MLPNTDSTTFTPDQEFAMNSNFLITRLFEKYIESGGQPSASAFNRHLALLVKTDVKPLLSEAKGKSASASDSVVSSIKAHFCRGRKWVIIPKDHMMFAVFTGEAKIQGYDDLLALWTAKEFAWVRFHSTKGTMVNFSIHPNSSVGSNVKHSMDSAAALDLEVINGTPKSNGFEERVQPKEADPEPEEEATETTEPEAEETPNETEVEVDQADEEETPNDEDLQREKDALINEILAEDYDSELGADIDDEFDIENI